MVEEIPTFESMFRKSKGLDLAEEAPFEGEPTPEEIQRIRIGDKFTDGDGNSRLEFKANVPGLGNFNPDVNAPQDVVNNADTLKAPKPFRRSAGFREMLARECFEKTGRIPDVEFMDTYEIRKAADGVDFNEMDGEEREELCRVGDNYGDAPKGTPVSECEFGTSGDAPKEVSKPKVSTPTGLYSALKDMGYSHNLRNRTELENYKTRANEFLTKFPNPDITDPKYHSYYLDMGLQKRKEATPNLPTSVPAPVPAPTPVEDYGTRTYDAPDDAIPDYYDGSPLPTAPDAKARVAEKNRQAKERAKSSSKGQAQMTLDGAEHQQMVDKISGAKNRAELEAVLNNMGYFRK